MKVLGVSNCGHATAQLGTSNPPNDTIKALGLFVFFSKSTAMLKVLQKYRVYRLFLKGYRLTLVTDFNATY